MRIKDARDCENHMVMFSEPEPQKIECPICGEECETVYLNIYCDPVGCDGCLRSIDVVDYWEMQKELTPCNWHSESTDQSTRVYAGAIL